MGRSVTNGKTQNQEFINFGDESFNNLIKVLIWVELEGLQDLNFVLFSQFQTSIESTNLSSKHLFLNDDANADVSCSQFIKFLVLMFVENK